jgi:hypothetical protein
MSGQLAKPSSATTTFTASSWLFIALIMPHIASSPNVPTAGLIQAATYRQVHFSPTPQPNEQNTEQSTKQQLHQPDYACRQTAKEN